MSKTPGVEVDKSTTKKKVGRPLKLTEGEREAVYNAFSRFILDNADPRITKFISVDEVALQYNITKDNMYDWEEFSELRKRAINKQEDYLLENGGIGKYNPTIAIFRLKQPQHGYKDRVEQDITSDGKGIAPVLVRFIDSDARNTDTD